MIYISISKGSPTNLFLTFLLDISDFHLKSHDIA